MKVPTRLKWLPPNVRNYRHFSVHLVRLNSILPAEPCRPPVAFPPTAPVPEVPPVAPPPSPVSYRPATDYAGTYSHPFFGPATFVANNDSLFLVPTDQPDQSIPLPPMPYPDAFQLGPWPLQFQRSPYGIVVSVSAPIEPGVDPIVFVNSMYSPIHWYGMPNGVNIHNSTPNPRKKKKKTVLT